VRKAPTGYCEIPFGGNNCRLAATASQCPVGAARRSVKVRAYQYSVPLRLNAAFADNDERNQTGLASEELVSRVWHLVGNIRS
jgi:hypothetical protein